MTPRVVPILRDDPADMVALLEDILVAVKAGDVTGIVIVGSMIGGDTMTAECLGQHANVMALFGELEATKLAFARQYIDGAT